jgi:hypothetical protein
MLGVLVIVLAVIDILLEGGRPRHIVDLRNMVSVELESTKELVETQAWVSSNVGNIDSLARGVEGSGNNNTGDMIDWDHIDGVVDVGTGIQLDTTLDHSNKEIISVGSTSHGVTQNVSGTDDCTPEASAASLTDEVLTGPLTLTVTCAETDTAALHIVLFTDTIATSSDDTFGFLDKVVLVQSTG